MLLSASATISPKAKLSLDCLTDLSLDSNNNRIKKTLPEALWPLLPLDPTPVCPYLDGAEGIPASLQRIAGKINTQLIVLNRQVPRLAQALHAC